MTDYVPQHLDNVLCRLEGVRHVGDNWAARCPCRNDDDNPSLSVGIGKQDQVLLFCQRAGGCDAREVCDTIGLKMQDLWPAKDEAPYERPTPRPQSPRVATPMSSENKEPDKWKEVETYDYTDENGELLFQKVRLVNQHGKKSFRQRKPDGQGGWEYKVWEHVDGEKVGPPQVLYNLPAVERAKANLIPIWVVEGEKDANTLNRLGYVATTMTGGAGNGKWLDLHTLTLRGATVEVIADNDEPGRLHAANVQAELEKAGCDVQVWISETHKDVTDHLSAGNSMDDLIPIEEFGSGMTPVAEASEEEVVAETPSARAINDLRSLLEDETLSDAQKIAKSNRLLSNAFTETPLDAGRLVVWEDFLREAESDTYDWAIPGLLERGERVIVVAAEGVGKTMLARQVAILASAGMHPLTFQRIEPVKTLTIDLENPERIIRRASRKIMSEAMKAGFVRNPQAHLLIKPSGLNLLTQEDRAIFERAIEEVKPQLLCIGPLYKSFVDPGGRTSEAIAVEVAKYLDSIRTIYNCAMWIEHHAPLGTSITSRDLRPFGSAVWSRWPEFGISLQPDPTAGAAYVYDVRHFRGARDERPWPTKMRRGVRFPFEVLEFMKVTT